MPKMIGLFLFGFCLTLVVTCTKTTTVTTDLLGTWVTQAPLYEDRYIQIKETEVIFGTGTETPTIFFINKIKEKKIDEFVEWTFQCKTIENIPTDIVLFFVKNEKGAHFELRNKRQVRWVKSNE